MLIVSMGNRKNRKRRGIEKGGREKGVKDHRFHELDSKGYESSSNSNMI